MDMESTSTACLICSRECVSSESLIEIISGGDITDPGGTFPLLEAQLTVLFVLRKLLQLPEAVCQRMISTHGNPSDWGTAFCLQCSGIVEEAQEVAHKISNLNQKFQCLQTKIQEELRNSFQQNDNENISSAKSVPREEIRKHCQKQKKYTGIDKTSSKSGPSKSNNKEAEKFEGFYGIIPSNSTITTDPEFNCVIKHSPVSVHFDDDYFEPSFNDLDYLAPESVVKIVSEAQEAEDEETARKSTRLSRQSSKKNKISQSGERELKSKKQNNKVGPKTEVTCPMCTKTFQNVTFLNLHYKKVHLGLDSAHERNRSRNLRKRKVTRRVKVESESDENVLLNARRQERKYRFRCPEASCTQFFKSEYFRDAHHKRKHLGIQKCFQCEKCGRAFDRNPSLTIHQKTCKGDGNFVHPADPKLQVSRHKCSKCPKYFLTELARGVHVKRKHEDVLRPYGCHICDHSYNRPSSLKEHLMKEHLMKSHRLIDVNGVMEKLNKDDVDDENLRNLDNEDQEDNSRTNDDDDWLPADLDDNDDNYEDNQDDRTNKESDYEPSGTDEESENPRRKSSSVKKTRRGRPKKEGGVSKRGIRKSDKPRKEPFTIKFKCTHEGCKKRFRLEAMRDGHIKQQHEGVLKPFECSHEGCTKTFKKYYSLQIHNETNHGLNDQVFICETCGKQFFNKIAFKRHIFHVHAYKDRQKKSHACDECGKMFKGKTDVERHKAVHREQPEVKCDVCEMVLKTNILLYYHRRSVHKIIAPRKDQAPFSTCEHPNCGKSFTTKARLQKHIEIVHDKFYKFSCKECGMGHADKSSFDRHMLKHTGYKPFTCDVCGKGVTRSSDLIRHMRLHTGERPYKCDMCDESFTDGSKLVKHKKCTHADPTQCCDICGKKFYTFTQLRLHKKIHEPGHIARNFKAPPEEQEAIKANKRKARMENTSTTVAVKPPKQRKPRKPKTEKAEKKPRRASRKKRIKYESDYMDTSDEEYKPEEDAPINLQLNQSGQSHINQLQHYQLPGSSAYNYNLRHPQSGPSSDLYRPNAAGLSDTSQQQSQGYALLTNAPGCQGFGLSYNIDPNYLNLAQNYVNPNNNNNS